MHTAPMSPCVLIPVYNHHDKLQQIVQQLVQQGLPVLLVDDGSHEACRTTLLSITNEFESVSLISRTNNGGKGAAIKDGLRAARKVGYSHALQIDADGQHNLQDVNRFLTAAAAQPESLVAGYPRYDESIPMHRYYGRFASHIWVWINCLSLQIRDSMCGFRVYPVKTSCDLVAQSKIGDWMEFDVEFIVRWYWAGLPLVQIETKVIYPIGGLSHFRPWQDNLLISWMHTRLFFGMLLRIPRLLALRRRRSESL